MYIYSGQRITVEEISKFFDECDPEVINHLGYQKSNGLILGIKDFFISHFHGCLCRYRKGEERIANAKFHLIYSDNIIALQKIIKYKDEIYHDLQRWSIYQDETHTTYKNTGSGNSTSTADSTGELNHTRNLIDGTLSGSSSAATMGTLRSDTLKVIESKNVLQKSDKKMLDYLDPNTKEVQQTINLYGGSDQNRSNQNNRASGSYNTLNNAESSSTSSNPFKDRLTYLNMKIPSLLTEFLENFRVLFHE